MQFALKSSTSQADASAPLLIDEVGLQYLNGAAVLIADRTKAAMVYNSGTLTITVKASITAQLEPGIYHYGLQDIAVPPSCLSPISESSPSWPT